MEALPSVCLALFTEQQESDNDPTFGAKLIEIAKQFAYQKKRIVFISRAWPLPPGEDKFEEEWSAEFAVILAKHLRLLNFEVILDVDGLGVGVHLNSAMGDSVEQADHVLLLITRTYLHKVTDCPDSGVAIEFSYVKEKIRRMGGGKEAGKRRFVLPFALTNDLTGFPLAEGHPGFAAIFVSSVGYRRALIDLATKVYNIEPALLRDVVPSHANVLIQAVKKCYSERRYIPRHFHEEPILIEEGYVRLAIVKEPEQREKEKNSFVSAGGGERKDVGGVKIFEDERLRSFEQIYGTKEPVELVDIFKIEKKSGGSSAKAESKRLLVYGRAGIGKSILCQKMANRWARSSAEQMLWEENGKEKFKLVVWVPLRNLLDYPSEATVCDVILRECILRDHSGERIISREAVLRGLKELKPSEILFVCDGYDEVAERTSPLIDAILSKEYVVVTTRPHGIQQYTTSDIARPFDKKLENIGFSNEDIEKYICVFFGEGKESQEYAESLIKYLKVHPNIWGIAHIPINLMLICVLWKDNQEEIDFKKGNDITVTDLYYGLLVNLCRRFLHKNVVKSVKSLSPKQVLMHERCRGILTVLSELAFHQMESESLLIPGKKLNPDRFYEHYPDQLSLRDDVLSFGVLMSTSSKTDSRSTEHYFLHLTLQELFAALHIEGQLRANTVEVKQYIMRNRYSSRHEMMWWFVAGLLKQKDKNGSRETLETFFGFLDAGPRDLVQVYHQMLLMRCMDECQLKVSEARKARYLDNLCKLIQEPSERIRFFYTMLLKRYLQLSQSVFGQSQVVAIVIKLLTSKEKRELVFGFLEEHTTLPASIINYIVTLLKDREWRNCLLAAKVLGAQKYIPVETERDIAVLLRNTYTPSDSFRAAIEFFKMRDNIHDEVIKEVAAMLDDEKYCKAAVIFFSTQKHVSEEVKRKIRAILERANEGMNKQKEPVAKAGRTFFVKRENNLPVSETVEFFAECKDNSQEIQRLIAFLFRSSDVNVRRSVLKYFEAQERVSEEIQEIIIGSLEVERGCLNQEVIKFFQKQDYVSKHIQDVFAAFLSKASPHDKLYVAFFFCSQKNVSDEIQEVFSQFLCSRDNFVLQAGIDFFQSRSNVSSSVENKIANIMNSNDLCIAAQAIRYFCSRKQVSSHIQSKIEGFLHYPSEKVNLPGNPVKEAAIEFFASRGKEASSSVKRAMTSLQSDKFRGVRERSVKFFTTQEDVPADTRAEIVSKLGVVGYHLEERHAAMQFLRNRECLSSLTVTEMEELFENSLNYEIRYDIVELLGTEDIWKKAFEATGKALKTGKISICNHSYLQEKKFLESSSVSTIVQCISRMNKRAISDDFLTAFITKLCMSNIALFQCSEACLQVGDSVQIKFDSRTELLDFVKQFKSAIVEYAGFDFDGAVSSEDFSEARAAAQIGLLSTPRVNSNNAGEAQNQDMLETRKIL